MPARRTTRTPGYRRASAASKAAGRYSRCSALDPDRHRVERGVTDHDVDDRGIGDVVDARARLLCRQAPTDPGARVAEAVWNRDHARADLVADLERQLDRADAGDDAHTVAGVEAARTGVLRVQQRGAAVGALHQPRAVVHPRVVAAQLAAADERQVVALAAGVLRLACSVLEPPGLGQKRRRRQLHAFG